MAMTLQTFLSELNVTVAVKVYGANKRMFISANNVAERPLAAEIAGAGRYRDIQYGVGCDIETNTVVAMPSKIPLWHVPWETPDQDCCHLNGVALGENKQPAYVSVLGTSAEPAGWRKNPEVNGAIIACTTNSAIATGLCFPHSPRVHRGIVYWLNAGTGTLSSIVGKVVSLPGFARGLALFGSYAVVGLSKMRNTDLFRNIILREEKMVCGIALVDIDAGEILDIHKLND